MKFEWDENKNKLNQQKHRVSFEEACYIFSDPFALSMFDPDHSENEDRFVMLGKSRNEYILVVIHTYRENDNEEVVRIISARKATKKEKSTYTKRCR